MQEIELMDSSLFYLLSSVGLWRHKNIQTIGHIIYKVTFHYSRRIFSVLLRRANAIKVWDNAIKMPDQHKYE